MEYVEGKTLADAIGRKGLPLRDALHYAIQVADALAAAHAAGIVHRDLKPGNIMLTGPASGHPGLVKLLDFGLARRVELEAGHDTTLTMTMEGAILGTPAYMSPEQAQGKPADARSDVFSFGSVLYQMVTGRRAFEKDSHVSTLAAVVQEEPWPLPLSMPRDLERVITRCLRKDPKRRFQHIDDVRVALLELKEETESGRLPEAASAPARKRAWLWAGAAVLVLALLGTGLWLIERRATPLPPPSIVPVTTYPGSQVDPNFSPDGKQIAFSWDGEKGDKFSIYVKLLGETNALRLTTSPTGDDYPAWAPDGKRIAFRRMGSDGGIYTVSPLGGAERKLTGLATNDYSQMSWSPDGKWLAMASNTQEDRGIFLLPVEGGEPRRISNPKPTGYDLSPAFAPDGHRLAYVGYTALNSCYVYVQELDSGYSPRGSPRQLTRQQAATIYGLTWSRDGGSVIYSASHVASVLFYLWRMGIDGRQPPQRLEVAGPQASCPSVSPTAGRLVFSRSLSDYDVWRYRTNGGMEPFIVSSAYDCEPQFSPDGTRIAFQSSRSGEALEIWVAQADGSKPVQMTHGLGPHQGTPSWSPDGRWIAFDSEGQDGHISVYVIDAAGSAQRRITSGPFEAMACWSRDGKWIYFRSDRTGRHEIWRVPFAGGPQEQVTRNGGWIAYESVDGQTLFYTKEHSGPLFARLLSGGEERQVLPFITARAFFPVAEGIYYIGPRSGEYYPLELFQFSSNSSRQLAKIGGYVGMGLSVSPDQKTILFTKSVSNDAHLMMIENFQ